MMQALSEDSVRVTAFGFGVLFARQIYTALGSLSANLEAGAHPSEDNKWVKGLMTEKNQSYRDHNDMDKAVMEKKKRWDRITLNDAENIPLGVGAMLASLLLNHNPNLHFFGVALFVGGRTLYTVCYHFGLQPFRTISWTMGLIGTGMLVTNSCLLVQSTHQY